MSSNEHAERKPSDYEIGKVRKDIKIGLDYFAKKEYDIESDQFSLELDPYAKKGQYSVDVKVREKDLKEHIVIKIPYPHSRLLGSGDEFIATMHSIFRIVQKRQLKEILFISSVTNLRGNLTGTECCRMLINIIKNQSGLEDSTIEKLEEIEDSMSTNEYMKFLSEFLFRGLESDNWISDFKLSGSE